MYTVKNRSVVITAYNRDQVAYLSPKANCIQDLKPHGCKSILLNSTQETCDEIIARAEAADFECTVQVSVYVERIFTRDKDGRYV